MTTTTKKIMRRVYMIHFARKIANPFTLKVLSGVFFVGWLREYVSLKAVLYNSPSFVHPVETVKFFSHAFWNTTLAVEVLTLSLVVIGLLVLRDAMKRFALASEYQALSSVLR